MLDNKKQDINLINNTKIVLLIVLVCIQLSNNVYGKILVEADSSKYGVQNINDDLKKKLDNLSNSMDMVKNGDRDILKILHSPKPRVLPVGKIFGPSAVKAAVFMDSLNFTAQLGILSVGAGVSFPSSGRRILFKASNIKLGKQGFTGDTRLQLVTDQDIKLGKKSILRFIGKNKKTFINWDCNGYSDLGIEAKIIFDSTMLKPVGKNKGYVTGYFETTITDFSDLIVDIKMDSFTVNDLDDFIFHPNQVVFDKSDIRNSETVQLPSDYQSDLLPEPNSPLWQGIYLKYMKLELPAMFKKKNSQKRMSFNLKEAIIDKTGFSGEIYAQDIFSTIKTDLKMPDKGLNELANEQGVKNNQGKTNNKQSTHQISNQDSVSQKPLNKPGIKEQENNNKKELNGDMSGWNYSLDELGVKLRHNQITKAWFRGKIEFPVAKKKTCLNLFAIMPQKGKYNISAVLQSAYPFSLFNSDVVLLPDSRIEIEVKEKKFKPCAILNGILTPRYADFIVGPITFQELKIMSDAPYIDVKAFSLGSDKLKKALNGLPVQINKIGFEKKEPNRYGMALDLTINIADGFAGSGGLVLWSKKEADKLRFKVDGLEVKKIAIDVNQGAFSLKGMAQWFKNVPEYGSGFKGMVEARFEPGISLQTSALFGKVDGFRYWYADGKMSIRQGVPVFPALNAYAFGGGMFKKMMHVGTEDPTSLSYDDIDPSKLGVTSSGMKYIPNIDAGMGLKAMVELASPDKTAVTINTIFETSFNNRGGLNYISFIGNGKFMKTMNISSLQEIQEKANAL
ncbi:MAG: hypothetical protein N4A49_08560, partial [Marinifilaceae bacterium]|nr:hypothetical protein [Marinifilaceae bacterium]